MTPEEANAACDSWDELYKHMAVDPANLPAFPTPDTALDLSGLTKREYFAAKAMQGITAFHGTYGQGNNCLITASRAVEMADALVLELNKPKL